jgi:aryl sulfotransferase
MSNEVVNWPKKTRDIHNHHMNSTLWNHVKFRDDDIVVASYPKSGTSWTQQIVSQLLSGGEDNIANWKYSLWIELRITPPKLVEQLERQTHRRFFKTHLPVDALVFSPKAKYLFVARDGRDVLWSLHHHHLNSTAEWYELINNFPGLIGPAYVSPLKSTHEYYRQWFEGDGYPGLSYWETMRSWWNCRNLPNVMLIHFNDLKHELAASMRKIATFLNIKIDPRKFPKIVKHCTFEYMKEHADMVAPAGGAFWEGGAKTFINKGSNGRWKDTLTPAEVKEYEDRAVKELGAECANWLVTGRS